MKIIENNQNMFSANTLYYVLKNKKSKSDFYYQMCFHFYFFLFWRTKKMFSKIILKQKLNLHNILSWVNRDKRFPRPSGIDGNKRQPASKKLKIYQRHTRFYYKLNNICIINLFFSSKFDIIYFIKNIYFN